MASDLRMISQCDRLAQVCQDLSLAHILKQQATTQSANMTTATVNNDYETQASIRIRESGDGQCGVMVKAASPYAVTKNHIRHTHHREFFDEAERMDIENGNSRDELEQKCRAARNSGYYPEMPHSIIQNMTDVVKKELSGSYKNELSKVLNPYGHFDRTDHATRNADQASHILENMVPKMQNLDRHLMKSRVDPTLHRTHHSGIIICGSKVQRNTTQVINTNDNTLVPSRNKAAEKHCHIVNENTNNMIYNVPQGGASHGKYRESWSRQKAVKLSHPAMTSDRSEERTLTSSTSNETPTVAIDYPENTLHATEQNNVKHIRQTVSVNGHATSAYNEVWLSGKTGKTAAQSGLDHAGKTHKLHMSDTHTDMNIWAHQTRNTAAVAFGSRTPTLGRQSSNDSHSSIIGRQSSETGQGNQIYLEDFAKSIVNIPQVTSAHIPKPDHALSGNEVNKRMDKFSSSISTLSSLSDSCSSSLSAPQERGPAVTTVQPSIQSNNNNIVSASSKEKGPVDSVKKLFIHSNSYNTVIAEKRPVISVQCTSIQSSNTVNAPSREKDLVMSGQQPSIQSNRTNTVSAPSREKDLVMSGQQPSIKSNHTNTVNAPSRENGLVMSGQQLSIQSNNTVSAPSRENGLVMSGQQPSIQSNSKVVKEKGIMMYVQQHSIHSNSKQPNMLVNNKNAVGATNRYAEQQKQLYNVSSEEKVAVMCKSGPRLMNDANRAINPTNGVQSQLLRLMVSPGEKGLIGSGTQQIHKDKQCIDMTTHNDTEQAHCDGSNTPLEKVSNIQPPMYGLIKEHYITSNLIPTHNGYSIKPRNNEQNQLHKANVQKASRLPVAKSQHAPQTVLVPKQHTKYKTGIPVPITLTQHSKPRNPNTQSMYTTKGSKLPIYKKSSINTSVRKGGKTHKSVRFISD